VPPESWVHPLLLNKRINLIQLGGDVFGQVLCTVRRDQHRIFQADVNLFFRDLKDGFHVEGITCLQRELTLVAGDEITVHIDGIGTLTNPVRHV